MLGVQVGEFAGRVVGMRALPASPLGEPRWETTLQGHGRLLGVACEDLATAAQRRRRDGEIESEGGTVILTGAGGESATLTGLGLGHPAHHGALRAVNALHLRTETSVWLPLTRALLVGEVEVDSHGAYTVKLWEWK